MPGSARPCWTASPIAPTFSRPARNRTDSGGKQQNLAVEMTGRGKRGKPKNGFPLFPPPLEIPQKQRDSHIPTATAAVLILTGRQSKSLTQPTTSQGGPN